MLQRILVGTDGSDTAGVAAAHAAAIARATGAELVVASAFSRPRGGQGELGRREPEGGEDQARSVVEHERRRLGDGIRVRTEVRPGHPAEVLLDLAEHKAADLIVVGNIGMTGARRAILGSVPNNISHHAPCHVLITNTRWATDATDAELRESPSLGRLLVGTDGSPSAEQAVRVAAELASALGAELVVVHAGDEEAGRRIVEDVAQGIEDGPAVSTLVTEGRDPAQALMDAAAERQADVIVVGNRGMTGAKRLLGSIPNTISHHADRHVLIVRTT